MKRIHSTELALADNCCYQGDYTQNPPFATYKSIKRGSGKQGGNAPKNEPALGAHLFIVIVARSQPSSVVDGRMRDSRSGPYPEKIPFSLAVESVHGSFKPGLRVCPAANAEFRLSRLI